MIISDLNYLEASSEEVLGGFLLVPNVKRSEKVDIDINEKFNIDKNVKSNALVKGNLGTAQANVFGYKNSLTQSTSLVEPGLNSSTAISAGNN
jgi:hypothetical protein